MRLTESEAWERLAGSEHGVLGTLHPERGPDLVPVVYAVDDERTIFIPVDTVKEKATTRLQRLKNLDADPRCTLLVDEYDDDWSRLWWVRVNGNGSEASESDIEAFRPIFTARYPQYADSSSIVGGIVIRPIDVNGWAAG